MKHEHKYFAFEKMTTFDPMIKLDTPDLLGGDDTRELAKQIDGMALWIRREWVVLACNCGDVIKRPIRTEDSGH